MRKTALPFKRKGSENPRSVIPLEESQACEPNKEELTVSVELLFEHHFHIFATFMHFFLLVYIFFSFRPLYNERDHKWRDSSPLRRDSASLTVYTFTFLGNSYFGVTYWKRSHFITKTLLSPKQTNWMRVFVMGVRKRD